MAENRGDIDHRQFVESVCLVATVLADSWWQKSQTGGQPVHRLSMDCAAMGIREAAKYLSVSRSKFYQLVHAEELPRAVKVGGRPKWLRVELDKYLARQQRRKV